MVFRVHWCLFYLRIPLEEIDFVERKRYKTLSASQKMAGKGRLGLSYDTRGGSGTGWRIGRGGQPRAPQSSQYSDGVSPSIFGFGG